MGMKKFINEPNDLTKELLEGFAIAHAVGILTTVFTAYTVTRYIVSLWVGWAKPKEVPL